MPSSPSLHNSITPSLLSEAISVLERGGVVVFATETAYGLACDARDERAVLRLMEMKGREAGKTFPLIAGSREMVEAVAGIPRGLMRLANQFWPGALTLVLPVLDTSLASGVVRDGEIAVRVSSHPVAQALSLGLGAPIVSTSANLSGEPVCYSIECVREQLGDVPDLYLDSGALTPEKPSTIVTLDDYGYPEVLRQGEVEID